MTGPELRDLINILEAARQLDAADDALRLLRGLRWADEAEKTAVWNQLPPLIQRWLLRAASGQSRTIAS